MPKDGITSNSRGGKPKSFPLLTDANCEWVQCFLKAMAGSHPALSGNLWGCSRQCQVSKFSAFSVSRISVENWPRLSILLDLEMNGLFKTIKKQLKCLKIVRQSFLCSEHLIDYRFVLSAAHCYCRMDKTMIKCQVSLAVFSLHDHFCEFAFPT